MDYTIDRAAACDAITTLGVHAVMLAPRDAALAATLHAAVALASARFDQAGDFLASAARALGRGADGPVQDDLADMIAAASASLAGHSVQTCAVRTALTVAGKLAAGTDPLRTGATLGELMVWTARLGAAMEGDMGGRAGRLAA